MTRFAPRCQKLLDLPRKIALRLRETGARGTLDWCWYQLAWRAREWRLGIDTRPLSHGITVDQHGECLGYEPIDHRCLDIILDYLGDSPNEVLVDYGCGKGRAVVMAATRPMRRVIGVEIDDRLAEIARRQVKRARARGRLRCSNVEIVTANATTWPFPDDVTSVFLFNSFTGSLLATAMDQMRASIERRFRPLKLVYVQPVVDRDTLADCPWLKRRDELPTGFWSHIRTVVYEPDPEAFEPPQANWTARSAGRQQVAGLN